MKHLKLQYYYLKPTFYSLSSKYNFFYYNLIFEIRKDLIALKH